MSETYDLIVIGAGMAAVAAANKCGAAGWRVAIVDALPYGDTCAQRGCENCCIQKEFLIRSLF
ncbi:MAG: FAD-dependent oxidoreductase [Hyphomicrobiales bacterium]